MGLDITTLLDPQHVAPLRDAAGNWTDEPDTGVTDFDSPNYPRAVYAGDFDRLDGRAEGWYVGPRGPSFRAGSYSGYNGWREALCRLALGVEPETVWAHRNGYAGCAFYELIDFSDCEGTIGPETSAKLARDFQRFATTARDAWGAGSREIRVYEDFRSAFERAGARNGFVRFF